MESTRERRFSALLLRLPAIFSILQPTPRPRRESSECMKPAKLFLATLLAAALACAPGLAFAGQSSPHKNTVGNGVHKAGKDTKTAAKDTGKAVTKGSKHAYHTTKHGTKKAWHATEHGSKKAWHKTKGTTVGAVHGAKKGAENSH